MRCPKCKQLLTETSKYYYCDCKIKIWKFIRGRQITPDIAVQLLKNGQSELLDGFIAKNTNKTYSGHLVVEDGKIQFKFPEESSPPESTPEKKTGNEHETIWIRAQSYNSGEAQLIIKGNRLSRYSRINYGHVSSAMAEILACITAANLVRHELPYTNKTTLSLSLNNHRASKYILNEMKSRDRSINRATATLFTLLKEFTNWEAYYKRTKRPVLKGVAHASTIPRGIFPWLNLVIAENNGNLLVKLPPSPDVIEQFKSSLCKAREENEENVFILPVTARPELMTWINNVKSPKPE
jgi:uncharacterized C2H2 Zn-finger protein